MARAGRERPVGFRFVIDETCRLFSLGMGQAVFHFCLSAAYHLLRTLEETVAVSEGLSQLKVKLLQLFRVVGLLRHTAPLRGKLTARLGGTSRGRAVEMLRVSRGI